MLMNKIIELLELSIQAEIEFIDSLSNDELNMESTPEKWSAKDIIAHNSHWREHHAKNILTVLEGGSSSNVDNIDHANEEVYHQYANHSWVEIKAFAKDSCNVMKAALHNLGDDGLQHINFFPWHNNRPLWRFVVGNVYTHPFIHLSDWHINKGNVECAAEMYQEMTEHLSELDDSPDWQGTIRYNVACSYSLLGNKEKAITTLREALQLNPDLKEWSQQDSDFDPIREEAEYQALYE